MNVYLLCSPEYDTTDYGEVVRFLTSFEGPLRFYATEMVEEIADIPAVVHTIDRRSFYSMRTLENYSLREMEPIITPREVKIASWRDLFGYAQVYRKQEHILESDFVILLTPLNNEYNWFCAPAPGNRRNGFVHTAHWQHYVKSPATYPVAYLVISLVLQRLMFEHTKDLAEGLHRDPLGCFNDYCKHKKEIILKLRTADICSDCLLTLKEKVESPLIQQALTIFEAVRVRMLFSQNFKQTMQPSRLQVKQGRIFLSDYGNIEITLRPLEKTLYFFFLNHPEGVLLTSLVDHRDELRQLYSRFSTSGLLTEVHARVEDLVDVRSNSTSEKLSKIKAAFVKAVGKDLAEYYIIKGGNGQPKKIGLDRTLLLK